MSFMYSLEKEETFVILKLVSLCVFWVDVCINTCTEAPDSLELWLQVFILHLAWCVGPGIQAPVFMAAQKML